jgi:hypothetical protein
MKAAWKWALTLSAMACAMNPPPVPLEGQSDDLRALAGEWSGEYQSFETGRTGNIYFKLTAGRDTAFGDVLMVPREQTGARTNTPPTARPPWTNRPMAQALSIRFVRVGGNLITGMIDPYPSPDCECQLLTTFRGEIRGNRIEGSFISHHSGQEMGAQKGTWWATRKTN